MGANLNLKTIFEADTRDLTKGAQRAKQDLKDFGKTSDEVLSKMGDALGVDTRKLEQLSNSAREVGRQLSESGNAGVAAFGKMLSSINAAQVAIAGLGIGAAITAFKALTAEAEAFKNTVAGANIEMQTAAYVSTYTQALHDMNAATGKSVAELESGLKKAWGRFAANVTQTVANDLTGPTTPIKGLFGPIAGNAYYGFNKDQRDEARVKAEEAERITGEIYNLTRKLKAESVEWASVEAQIAEYRRIAKDDSYTLAHQQDAIAQAQALIEQRYGAEYTIRQNIADLQKELVGLTNSSVDAEDKMYQAQIDSDNVLRNKEQMIKSLNRDQKSLTAQAAKEAEARRQAAAALEAQAQKMRDLRASVSSTDLSVSAGAAAGVTGQATTMQIGAVIKPTYDPKEILDISKEIASIVEMGIAGMSESIGSLIGDLATGGDAWHNFANNALSAFGDMAISVGKMAISVGTATLGIRAALESLNGYVAIAAGAALVALGQAVKTGLGNIASGNYSAAASVSGPSYGTTAAMGGGYASSVLNIKVTGTLVGEGSQLKAVLDNEDSRRKTVT
jgi:hypothetical protein